jgi:hypothetical protein
MNVLLSYFSILYFKSAGALSLYYSSDGDKLYSLFRNAGTSDGIRPSRSRIKDRTPDWFSLYSGYYSLKAPETSVLQGRNSLLPPNTLAIAWSSPDISIISSCQLRIFGSKGDIYLWFKFNVGCRLFSYLCFTLDHIGGVGRRQLEKAIPGWLSSNKVRTNWFVRLGDI